MSQSDAIALAAPAVTAALYILFRHLYARRPTPLAMPIVGATCVLITVMVLAGIDPTAYERGTRPLSWMLGPATVAMAVPLFRLRALLRAHARAVLISVGIGAAASIVSVLTIGRFLRITRPILLSLAPKSVTNPIAIPIAERLGGIGPLAAAIVVITGVLGMVIGPWLLSVAGIRKPLARGLALGTSAHAAGTARALDLGPIEAATSGAAMIIAGLITAILAPLLVPLWL